MNPACTPPLKRPFSESDTAAVPEQGPLPCDPETASRTEGSLDSHADLMARVQEYAPQVVGFFQRAFTGRSRVAAIKARCYDCVGFEHPYSEIGCCPTPECPLWEFRALKKGSPSPEEIERLRDKQLAEVGRFSLAWRKLFVKAFAGKSRAAAIKAFCAWCSNYQRLEIKLCQNGDCPLFMYRPYCPKEAQR